MITKNEKRKRFIDEELLKHCIHVGNLPCIEGLYEINGEKVPKKVYLELVDVFVKCHKYKEAIEAANKAGKDGSLRLIHHGYLMYLVDSNLKIAADFFEAANHVDGILMCAKKILEANFLEHGRAILRRAATLKIK